MVQSGYAVEPRSAGLCTYLDWGILACLCKALTPAEVFISSRPRVPLCKTAILGLEGLVVVAAVQKHRTNRIRIRPSKGKTPRVRIPQPVAFSGFSSSSRA